MTTTISGSSGIVFPDLTTMQTGQQAVKAWVNFNGTGTVAIRAGYNVSSITDNGVGLYTVNFTTAMPDANYAAIASGPPEAGSGNKYYGYTDTASRATYISYAGTGSLVDTPIGELAIFR
tara:strand:- start:35 stop:394 length:360 start_codon:yes stop_codon:yes gene_type:complete